MQNLGVSDTNAGKHGANPEGKPSRNNIKNQNKKCYLNFLPNYPEGHDDASLESVCEELAKEYERTPSASVLSQNMDFTFALRHKEMVTSAPEYL